MACTDEGLLMLRASYVWILGMEGLTLILMSGKGAIVDGMDAVVVELDGCEWAFPDLECSLKLCWAADRNACGTFS